MANKHNFTGIIIPVIVAIILLTVLPIINSINEECPPCEEIPSYNIGNIEVNPDFSSGDYIVDKGSYDYINSATIIKDENLIPENIKKDVNIFGVVGTLESGGGGISGGIYFPWSGSMWKSVTITISDKTTVTMDNTKTNYLPIPSDWLNGVRTLNITITNYADNCNSSVGILYDDGYGPYINFNSSSLSEYTTTMSAYIDTNTIIVINTYGIDPA